MIGPKTLSNLSNRQKDKLIESIFSLGNDVAYDSFNRQASGQPTVGNVDLERKFSAMWDGPNNLKRTAFAIR